MKLVFMGTPVFAVPCLQALVGAGHRLQGVVTQPDRPRNRGKKVQASPVKEEALALGIPVYQPDKVRDDKFIGLLDQLKPDIIVVVAFGQILPAAVLNLPALGCVNVHASLLPEYRGAAPIQRVIMNGGRETGVTTMLMDTGLDTGDMLLRAATAIAPEDSFGTLHDRLSRLGADILLETVKLLEAGKLTGVPQDHGKATYAPAITREDEIINWGGRAKDILNQVRGLDPWPGARTSVNGSILKIWRARETETAEGKPGILPGQVLGPVGEGLAVQCGDQPLVITELQMQGGKRLPAADFLRGVRLAPGAVLGSGDAAGSGSGRPGEVRR